MKSLVVAMLALVIFCSAATAATSVAQRFGPFGLGTVGGLAGAVVAVIAIAEIGPRIDSPVGNTALVIGSLTVFDGLGAAAGVLTAGRIWDVDGNVSGSVLGGLAGGLGSAFVEPLLSIIGVPEGWTEFLGMALLPILPALGATFGFGQ